MNIKLDKPKTDHYGDNNFFHIFRSILFWKIENGHFKNV